uniref:Uncharacterized protein n=1 Tax=Rhizophora mucronata TaxID=61149 RepID=A0A2P2PM06_RHIMU
MSLKKGRSIDITVVIMTNAVLQTNLKRFRPCGWKPGIGILISFVINSLSGNLLVADFSMKAKSGWQ